MKTITPSPIKSESIKVLALAILLALGAGYLSLIDSAEPTRSNGVIRIYADASNADSLRLALEGHAIPALYAHHGAAILA